MSGFGGMFSFGHAAYFGLGAYISVLLLVEHGVSPWVAMVVGMVVAAAFGVADRLPRAALPARRRLLRAGDLRVRRDAALWCHQQRLRQPRGGLQRPAAARGVSGSACSSSRARPTTTGSRSGSLVVALAVNILFVRSRTGQYTMAARDDQNAAAALGVPVMRYQLATVALARRSPRSPAPSTSSTTCTSIRTGVRVERVDPGDPAGRHRRGRHDLGAGDRRADRRPAQRRDRHAAAQPPPRWRSSRAAAAWT